MDALSWQNAEVSPVDPSRSSKRHSFEVIVQARRAGSASDGAGAAAGGGGSGASGGRVGFLFAAENRDDCEAWLAYLAAAAVPPDWPGGWGPDKRPKAFLFSRVEREAALAAMRALQNGKNETEAARIREETERRLSPVHNLPLLKSVASWRQRALLLQKIRLCSVVFDIPETVAGAGAAAQRTDPSGMGAPDAASGPGTATGPGPGGPLANAPGAANPGGVLTRVSLEARDTKRQTLLELVDFCDTARNSFTEWRVVDDMFNMLRCNLFRALPTAPEPSGDPDEAEEEPFMDPQWPHLSVAYELLLHLVSLDHVDLAMKKKVIDASFVRSLLQLFDSEDMRERDYLKTITHRIYSKLTQRRALIRRVICNIFFEFVYETHLHNGVAEMLEILASIINGFAVPIKEEHKVMLERALLPLHKPASVMAYHPQLSYCMALYVAKDHTLTRKIVPGLLRYWPFGSSNKQIMFLNELDDVFEYVQEDDMPHFRKMLGRRLARCLGGLHFQVAERTLCLWHSERFAALMLEDPETRTVIFPMIFSSLRRNAHSHWHEGVRTLSSHILEQYAESDPTLYHKVDGDFQDAGGLEGPSAGGGLGDDEDHGGLGPIDRTVAFGERVRILENKGMETTEAERAVSTGNIPAQLAGPAEHVVPDNLDYADTGMYTMGEPMGR